MSAAITASMLYDLVACPHRVSMDLFGDPAMRDDPNPFVQMLWEKGSIFEQEVMQDLDAPFLDLSQYSGDEKERLTTEAMQKGEPLIYSGRISHGDLLGEPDLLRKEAEGYIAGDIKSGAALEGSEDISKPKVHYAVQLGLYTDILEKKNLLPARRAFIWDVRGDEVTYDFTEVYGVRNPKTLWQDYEECLTEARAIVQKSENTLPAYGGVCKLCHWYSACMKQLSASDDLTLIPELGRSKRDVMMGNISTIKDFSRADPAEYINGKKTAFAGIGPDTLHRFHDRAKLISAGSNAKPYFREHIPLPETATEIFFDIEVDPMRDLCYLHGFITRTGGNNESEIFTACFADEPTKESEKQAFSEAWAFMKGMTEAKIYYYSKYERTIYFKLQERYPDICTRDEVEALFDPSTSIDLYYDVVKKATEWPTRDHSIKTLATYLGFKWRDTHPSGAASIEWFDRWIKTSDQSLKQRILDYNEDDCRATRVLLDGLRAIQEAA